ncbi:hypothetical protein [Micromonospora sp. IBSANI012]|uniref:hypothetical protein n=1 Tax=Micromonospora sp. IBSANI012 TaxID=3457761 RepID=UPI0040584976
MTEDQSDPTLPADAARMMGLASQILLAYWDEDGMEEVGRLVNSQPHDAIEALIRFASLAHFQLLGGQNEGIAKLKEFAIRAEIELGNSF